MGFVGQQRFKLRDVGNINLLFRRFLHNDLNIPLKVQKGIGAALYHRFELVSDGKADAVELCGKQFGHVVHHRIQVRAAGVDQRHLYHTIGKDIEQIFVKVSQALQTAKIVRRGKKEMDVKPSKDVVAAGRDPPHEEPGDPFLERKGHILNIFKVYAALVCLPQNPCEHPALEGAKNKVHLLQQGDLGAIDGDKVVVFPNGGCVDIPGDQVFAVPVISAEQDGDAALRKIVRTGDDGLELRTTGR